MSAATLPHVKLEILNATADDAENLEQIYKLLQRSEFPVPLTEVAGTVHPLESVPEVMAETERANDRGQRA